LTYDVYFDTVDASTLVASDISSAAYDPPLAYSTTYYWKIVASDGVNESAGSVWSFTTRATNQAPNNPNYISPDNGASDVILNAKLYWSCLDPEGDGLTYDVYFDAVDGSTLVASDSSATIYDPGTLSEYSTYYWKIVASDGVNETVGPVWSFTTGNRTTTGIAIGVTASSTTGLETTVPLMGIIQEDINAYLNSINSNITIEFVIKDNQGTASIALANTQEFKAEGIDLIIGHGWSSQCGASLSYVNENDMLLLSSSSTSPLYAIPNDRLFRTSMTDFVQGHAIAAMWRTLGIEAVLTMHRADAWGDGIWNVLEPLWEPSGIEDLGRIRYAGEVTEFSSYLAQANTIIEATIAEYGSDKVGLQFFSFDEIRTIQTQAADYPNLMGLIWMGTESGGRSELMLNEAEDLAVQTHHFSALPAVNTSHSGWSELDDRYFELTERRASWYTASQYDACWLLVETILETGSTDPSVIAEALIPFSETVDGLSGNLALDEYGDRQPQIFDIWGFYEDPETGVNTFRSWGTYDGQSGTVDWNDTALNEYAGINRPAVIEGEWNVSLSVGVGGYAALNATFGMRNEATGGFDADAGDQILPPGFAGVESYFYHLSNPSSPVDLRKLFVSYLPAEYPANWTFKVHTFTGVSGETTLSWDTSDIISISADYQVNLDTPTGSVNMREANQYTWTASEETTYTFMITLTSEVEYTLQLKAGWNMVSLPVVPDDLTANAVMPSGLFFQLVTWSGTGYFAASDFEAGRGYWLLVLEDVNVTVTGIPVDEVTLTLSPGWSMVGGTFDEVQAAAVFPGFYQLVTWTGTGYTPASTFEPGRGYWALVLAETQIQLPPT